MGLFDSTKTPPIIQQLDDYLRWCELNRRMTPSTMKTKRQCINKFLAEHPDITDFTDVNNRTIEDWGARMTAEGKRGKTVNNYTDHVIACLRFLQNKRAMRLSVRFEGIDRAVEERDDLPIFTPKEIKRIKDCCSGLRDLLLVSLIFESALRINEVSTLKLDNIEDLHVRVKGKGRKLRDTFIMPETRKLLDRWLMLSGIVDGYIFPSPIKEGEPLHLQYIRSAISVPIRKAGFANGGAHAIRRSSITSALDNGMYIQDAATWAGHSDPKITMQYYYRANVKELARRHAQAFSKNI